MLNAAKLVCCIFCSLHHLGTFIFKFVVMPCYALCCCAMCCLGMFFFFLSICFTAVHVLEVVVFVSSTMEFFFLCAILYLHTYVKAALYEAG